MSISEVTTCTFLLVLAMANSSFCLQNHNPNATSFTLQTARTNLLKARVWVQSSMVPRVSLDRDDEQSSQNAALALRDCNKLYDESEPRLHRLISGESGNTVDDALTWLSGVLANHRSCLKSLAEKGFVEAQSGVVAQNLTSSIEEALALYANIKKGTTKSAKVQNPNPNPNGLLASWNPATSKADFVVAKDGSGTHGTINDAVAALARMRRGRAHRAIVYVKAGVYNEKVEIGRKLRNVMVVGDGIGKTIVTGGRSVRDGATTLSSATFGVSGDGFWARDMTFENTAGPQKHQAVALRVSSDLSVFYRCAAVGYQDTLYAHSLRQFYRDFHLYGTVDFLFGDAIAVIQNSDIVARRPMPHQANMITAQGRENPNQNSGFSVHASRVRASAELEPVKARFQSFLGRPWKKYSRTVFMKTDMDGLIDPRGWTEWRGSFALSTLFYGEYRNTGLGASTESRVKWPGFHVIGGDEEANAFSLGRFLQGGDWIPVTGVPFWLGV